MAIIDFVTLSPKANPATPPAGWVQPAWSVNIATTLSSFLCSSGIDGVWYFNTLSGAGTFAEATLGSSSNGGVALVDASGNGYLMLVNTSNCRVFTMVAGSLSTLVNTTAITPSTGELWRLETDTAGNFIVYQDGVSVDTFADATYTGDVYPAAYSRSTAGGITKIETGVNGSTVTTTGPYKPADTITYSTTGLGTITSATLTDSAANVLTLTSVTDTTAAIPAFTTSGQQANLFGTVTLTVGDGTDTATTTFTLDPPTGYTAVTASGLTVPSTNPLTWNYPPTGGWTNEPADTDQLFHNDAFITYNADGSTTYTPGDLGTSYTAVYYLIDATDGKLTKVTKNYLDGVPVFGTASTQSISLGLKIGI